MAALSIKTHPDDFNSIKEDWRINLYNENGHVNKTILLS